MTVVSQVALKAAELNFTNALAEYLRLCAINNHKEAPPKEAIGMAQAHVVTLVNQSCNQLQMRGW